MGAGTKDSAKAAAERRGSVATAGVDDAPPPCSSAATWQSLHAGGGADMGAGPTSVPCFALLPQDVFADLTNYLSLPDILTLRASCAANVYLCNELSHWTSLHERLCHKDAATLHAQPAAYNPGAQPPVPIVASLFVPTPPRLVGVHTAAHAAAASERPSEPYPHNARAPPKQAALVTASTTSASTSSSGSTRSSCTGEDGAACKSGKPAQVDGAWFAVSPLLRDLWASVRGGSETPHVPSVLQRYNDPHYGVDSVTFKFVLSLIRTDLARRREHERQRTLRSIVRVLLDVIMFGVPTLLLPVLTLTIFCTIGLYSGAWLTTSDFVVLQRHQLRALAAAMVLPVLTYAVCSLWARAAPHSDMAVAQRDGNRNSFVHMLLNRRQRGEAARAAEQDEVQQQEPSLLRMLDTTGRRPHTWLTLCFLVAALLVDASMMFTPEVLVEATCAEQPALVLSSRKSADSFLAADVRIAGRLAASALITITITVFSALAHARRQRTVEGGNEFGGRHDQLWRGSSLFRPEVAVLVALPSFCLFMLHAHLAYWAVARIGIVYNDMPAAVQTIAAALASTAPAAVSTAGAGGGAQVPAAAALLHALPLTAAISVPLPSAAAAPLAVATSAALEEDDDGMDGADGYESRVLSGGAYTPYEFSSSLLTSLALLAVQVTITTTLRFVGRVQHRFVSTTLPPLTPSEKRSIAVSICQRLFLFLTSTSFAVRQLFMEGDDDAVSVLQQHSRQLTPASRMISALLCAPELCYAFVVTCYVINAGMRGWLLSRSQHFMRFLAWLPAELRPPSSRFPHMG